MGLKLTRRTGQSIILSKGHEEIARITIDTNPMSTSIGVYIEAPKDVEIMRAELLEKTKLDGTRPSP